MKIPSLNTNLIALLIGLISIVAAEPASAQERFYLNAASVEKLKSKVVGGERFDGGWYSKIGSATVFMAPTSVIPDFERLNWALVRVLSEKYGCFIDAKLNTGNETKYLCRDNRTIVTHRYKNRDWVVFHARQFDSRGREMIVEDRRIIGYGPRQI